MHRVRRKLSEPRTAGQRSADSLRSQRTTSVGDSESICFMSYMCYNTHINVKQNQSTKIAKSPLFSVLKCLSRQKLASFCRETHAFVPRGVNFPIKLG